ncbi:MAG: hypothetical protein N3A01_04135 [Bacteroidales bacterium]|nr:hypothetical protein [Bacteroidales bacterium]
METKQIKLIDDSRVIIEALARAGADVYIGYPITPANLLYFYASQRFKYMLPAPDEISTMQYMSGMALTGHLPVTATSFPGLALMVESINMAYMMELPMVIVLSQRLGPATGTATGGAQGDILLLNGIISGGHPLPVFCPADILDCWILSAKALEFAYNCRTPVVILTSKERTMTSRSFDISTLPEIKPIEKKFTINPNKEYLPYEYTENLVPPFLPITQNTHQVRITASTHDQKGIIQHTSPEAMQNTIRLEKKIRTHIKNFVYFEHKKNNSNILVISYGISANAAQEAMRISNNKFDLLIVKTLLPVVNEIYEIIDNYTTIIVAEDNINAQYAKILFGDRLLPKVKTVGAIGKMLSPDDILKTLNNDK